MYRHVYVPMIPKAYYPSYMYLSCAIHMNVLARAPWYHIIKSFNFTDMKRTHVLLHVGTCSYINCCISPSGTFRISYNGGQNNCWDISEGVKFVCKGGGPWCIVNTHYTFIPQGGGGEAAKFAKRGGCPPAPLPLSPTKFTPVSIGRNHATYMIV